MANSEKGRIWIIVGALVGAVVAAMVGGYLFRGRAPAPIPMDAQTEKAPLPRMANLPEKKPSIDLPPPPDYPPDAPVLETARDALREGLSPEAAVQKALSLPDAPETADAAFLLLEYAADSGNAQAALLVAQYYDPTDDKPSGTIRKNPETAYGWYREALANGREDAREQLERLRRWLDSQAEQGSEDARRLLKTWR